MLKMSMNQTTQLTTTMTTTELATKIASLKPGYLHGTNIPGKRGGVYVRPKNGAYECETCWIVPEAHADNPTSFAARADIKYGACYVGRRQMCETADEAAAVYVAMKEAREKHQPYAFGEKFGNVER